MAAWRAVSSVRWRTSPADPAKRTRWHFSSSKRRLRQVSPVAFSAIEDLYDAGVAAVRPPVRPRVREAVAAG